jgi:tRNA dimethylallyltransferase
VQVGLDLPTPALDARIAQRVDAMMANGFLAEVAALERVGLREGRTASRALGYAQLLAVLDGRLTESEAVTETARATRRFVRRQRSWFRRDPRIQWYDGREDLVERVLSLATD